MEKEDAEEGAGGLGFGGAGDEMLVLQAGRGDGFRAQCRERATNKETPCTSSALRFRSKNRGAKQVYVSQHTH